MARDGHSLSGFSFHVFSLIILTGVVGPPQTFCCRVSNERLYGGIGKLGAASPVGISKFPTGIETPEEALASAGTTDGKLFSVPNNEVEMIVDPKSAEIKRWRGTGAVLLTAVGLVGSFSLAACCALPFLLAGTGIGIAWLGGLAPIAAPHRMFLITVSAICLVGGAVLLWRQRSRIACTPDRICARAVVRGLTLVGLLAGLVFLCLGYVYV